MNTRFIPVLLCIKAAGSWKWVSPAGIGNAMSLGSGIPMLLHGYGSYLSGNQRCTIDLYSCTVTEIKELKLLQTDDVNLLDV